jgi:hypothetical protein
MEEPTAFVVDSKRAGDTAAFQAQWLRMLEEADEQRQAQFDREQWKAICTDTIALRMQSRQRQPLPKCTQGMDG